MTINLFDAYGLINLAQISDAQIFALPDEKRAAIEILIAAVIAKGNATERFAAARKRTVEAMSAEDEAQRLHLKASPPPTELEALRTSQASYRASH
jgi:hypothetical protein